MENFRINPNEPLLKELMFVNVEGDDGESFDVLLTRVPGLGEEIDREDPELQGASRAAPASWK